MICSQCLSPNVAWVGPLSNLHSTRCPDCGAVNSQVVEPDACPLCGEPSDGAGEDGDLCGECYKGQLALEAEVGREH